MSSLWNRKPLNFFRRLVTGNLETIFFPLSNKRFNFVEAHGSVPLSLWRRPERCIPATGGRERMIVKKARNRRHTALPCENVYWQGLEWISSAFYLRVFVTGLRQVSAVAHGIAFCGRDWDPGPCFGSVESQPLDHQARPSNKFIEFSVYGLCVMPECLMSFCDF